MKYTNLLGLLLLSLLIFGVTFAIGAGDHGGHDDEVTDHCTNPTAELYINASAGELSYDKNEYKVEKNTCYDLIFTNEDEIIEHDVNIDEHHDEYEFDKVHIHVANHTDGDHGTKSMHIQTPDYDTDMTLYCSVTGHRASGMEATLIVGEGTSDGLPFNAFYGFLALAFLVITVPVIRKRA